MVKYFPLLILLLTPSVKADIYHSISSSVKLEVAAAATAADRIGNSLSISGSGVNTTDGTPTGSVGGLGAATNGVNAYTAIIPQFLLGLLLYISFTCTLSYYFNWSLLNT